MGAAFAVEGEAVLMAVNIIAAKVMRESVAANLVMPAILKPPTHVLHGLVEGLDRRMNRPLNLIFFFTDLLTFSQ